LLAGCGSPVTTIKGKVTLDDEPLEQGSISFVPSAGTKGPLTGAVIANGQYAIESKTPMSGTYKVEISLARKTGKKIPVPPPAPAGTMVDQVAEAIPAKYNTESTLTREVKAAHNEFDFDLKSKGN
jgi:hypothetical protein